MNISVVVIVVYLTGVTIAGSLLARRARGSGDWAVAGGGMSLTMIAVGIAGTRIGGAGTYGVAGNVMSGGLWNMWWYGINTFLALAFVGIFFAVPFRRLRLQTVGEIFTIRFGSRRCQVLTSMCVQTEYFIINIIEAFVIGSVLSGLTGMSMLTGVLIAAFVLVSYTALGGLWGTAVTNLIHCTVILVGLALVGVMGIRDAGGWEAVRASVDAHLAADATRDPASWWGFAGAGWGAVLGMFFSAAVHTPAASVYTNYSTAARSEKILVPGFLIAGGLGAIMPMLAGLIGILTVAKYGLNAGTRGYTNLTKLATEIDPVIGGIALAAVLAAVVSSGGPILLSSATMFVRDWLPFTKDYSSTAKLKVYRLTTVVYGVLAALIAWRVSMSESVSVLDMLLFGFAMVVPPAIAVGYLLYWRRTTESGAFWGMASGYIAGLAWFLTIKWAVAVEFVAGEGASSARRLFYYLFVHNGKGVDPSYATTFIPLVVIPLISLVTVLEKDGGEPFYTKAWTPADADEETGEG